jgi:hypothetical protein
MWSFLYRLQSTGTVFLSCSNPTSCSVSHLLQKLLLKIVVLWYLTSCSLIDIYQRFGGTYFFCLQGWMGDISDLNYLKEVVVKITVFWCYVAQCIMADIYRRLGLKLNLPSSGLNGKHKKQLCETWSCYGHDYKDYCLLGWMWHSVLWQIFSNVSEEYACCIFRVEFKAKKHLREVSISHSISSEYCWLLGCDNVDYVFRNKLLPIHIFGAEKVCF